MGAWFEVNIDGRAFDLLGGIIDGIDFGVVAPESLMISLPDDAVFLYNDATHHGVGTDPCLSLQGKPEGPFHIEFISHDVVLLFVFAASYITPVTDVKGE